MPLLILKAMMFLLYLINFIDIYFKLLYHSQAKSG